MLLAATQAVQSRKNEHAHNMSLHALVNPSTCSTQQTSLAEAAAAHSPAEAAHIPGGAGPGLPVPPRLLARHLLHLAALLLWQGGQWRGGSGDQQAAGRVALSWTGWSQQRTVGHKDVWISSQEGCHHTPV